MVSIEWHIRKTKRTICTSYCRSGVTADRIGNFCRGIRYRRSRWIFHSSFDRPCIALRLTGYSARQQNKDQSQNHNSSKIHVSSPSEFNSDRMYWLLLEWALVKERSRWPYK